MPKINICGAEQRRKREELLKLLKCNIYAAGGVATVAPKAGMTRCTLYNRLKDPDAFSLMEIRGVCRATGIKPVDIIPLLPL